MQISKKRCWFPKKRCWFPKKRCWFPKNDANPQIDEQPRFLDARISVGMSGSVIQSVRHCQMSYDNAGRCRLPLSFHIFCRYALSPLACLAAVLSKCPVARTDKSYSEPVLCTYLTPSLTNRALYLGRAVQI